MQEVEFFSDQTLFTFVSKNAQQVGTCLLCVLTFLGTSYKVGMCPHFLCDQESGHEKWVRVPTFCVTKKAATKSGYVSRLFV